MATGAPPPTPKNGAIGLNDADPSGPAVDLNKVNTMTNDITKLFRQAEKLRIDTNLAMQRIQIITSNVTSIGDTPSPRELQIHYQKLMEEHTALTTAAAKPVNDLPLPPPPRGTI